MKSGLTSGLPQWRQLIFTFVVSGASSFYKILSVKLYETKADQLNIISFIPLKIYIFWCYVIK